MRHPAESKFILAVEMTEDITQGRNHTFFFILSWQWLLPLPLSYQVLGCFISQTALDVFDHILE